MLIGSADQSEFVTLQAFLTRNGHPHRVVDTKSDEANATEIMSHYQLTSKDLPAVVQHNSNVMRRPNPRAVADVLGLSKPSGERSVYDVVVVGVGPGGLAAAVNAAAEGLSVLAIESNAPGGQRARAQKSKTIRRSRPGYRDRPSGPV